MPSPFFPGYGGDKSVKPQFFPGYYVGDPLARPPKYVGGITPTEFAPDPLINFTNGLERDLGSLFQFDHFLPSYWREQIEADFKRTLNAVGESDSSGTDHQSAMEQGDFNEGVGVQVKVNIDLPEIISDPKKWVENTAKDFGKSIFNGDDFRDWVENRYVWAPLIAGTAADSTTEHDRLGGIAPADAVARAAFYAGKEVRRTTVGASTVVVTPLQLNLSEFAEKVAVGSLPDDDRKKIAQKYRKVGESFLGFVEDVDAFGKREGNYVKLQSNILKGVEEELNKLKTAGDIPNTIPNVDENLRFFKARFEVMKALEDLTGDDGLKGINKTLAANFLEKPKAGNDPVTGLPLGGTPTPPGQTIYDRLIGGWNKPANVNDIVGAPEPGFVTKLRTAITAGEAGLNANQLAIYRQQTEGLKKLAEDLEKFANKNKNLKAGDPRIGLIMGDLSGVSGHISRPGIFRGLQDNYINRFMEDVASGKHGIKEIQEYLRARDPNYLVGMDNSLRVYKIARRYFNSAEAVDIVGHLEGGKFIRNYLYNQRLINRVMGYTPAALSTEFLKRVHYFGLSYDPEYDNKKVLWVIPAAKFFGAFCGKNEFEISYNVGGISKSVKFTGTGDFKAAMGLFKAMAKPENANPINNIMTEMLADFWAPHGSAIVDKLAKEKITYVSFDKLRKLLATKFGLTSGTPLSPTQQEELKSFLLALGHYDGKNYNLSIALAKAGLLQHIAAGASKIQTGFYIFLDKIGIGKVISAYHQLKLAAAELVAQSITKLLQLLAAAGTFGTSTLIAPLIEALGRFIKITVLWLWSKVENFLGALLKGDLSGYWKGLEKGMNNLIKVSLYILMIPVILGLLVMFMMGTIIGGIGPVNTGAGGGGGGGSGGGTMPPGPVIKVGSCPLQSPKVVIGSYNSPEGVAHGTNPYWRNNANCTYAIPYISYPASGTCGGGAISCSPQDRASMCYNLFPNARQAYYGYAMDVFTNSSNYYIYLPSLGEVKKWTLGPIADIINDGKWGTGVMFRAKDDEHDYLMYLGHIVADSSKLGGTFDVNTSVGKLFEGPDFGTHTHIELVIDGKPVKPENYLCK